MESVIGKRFLETEKIYRQNTYQRSFITQLGSNDQHEFSLVYVCIDRLFNVCVYTSQMEIQHQVSPTAF